MTLPQKVEPPKALVILDTNAVVHLTRFVLNPPVPTDILERVTAGELTAYQAFEVASQPVPPELFIYTQYQANALTLAFNKKLRQEWWEVVVDLRDITNQLDGTSRRERMSFIGQLGDCGLLLNDATSALKCRDRKDQMVLEAAEGAIRQGHGKVFILTHDADLLVLKERASRYAIMKPLPFAERWSGFAPHA